MKDIAVEQRQKLGSGIVTMSTIDKDGKAGLVVALSPDCAVANNASDLVKIGAAIMGGKGGGKPDLAQAGAPDASKLDEALEAIKNAIKVYSAK